LDLTVQGDQSPASYIESADDWPPPITRVPHKPKVAQFCAAPWPNFTPPLTAHGGLEAIYEAQIIGGPGAFVVTAEDRDSFARAVKRKLILEISAVPGPRVLAGR
jgi:hypothetical protein